MITDAIARELSGFVWAIAKQTKARSWTFHAMSRTDLLNFYLTHKEIVTDPRREPAAPCRLDQQTPRREGVLFSTDS